MLRTDPPCLLPHPGHAGDEAGHGLEYVRAAIAAGSAAHRSRSSGGFGGRGIGTGVSYEAAHPHHAVPSSQPLRGELPNTERIARETVTLPLFPTMTRANVERVCNAVAEVLVKARI
ncbi:MAG: DegT/DnrJ/EryC1/StrS family aminotransferase [Candidatus Competibacteraceae bacterium]